MTLRVGRTRHPNYRQVGGRWRPPWNFRKRSVGEDPIGDPYERDDEPDWFSLDDFPKLPEDDWRELETWCAGGLGLFESDPDPLPIPIPDFHRVGLEFENEIDHMTEAAVPMLRLRFGGSTIHTEFPYGWKEHDEPQGRTDVVVCAFDGGAYRRRRAMVGESHLKGRWGYLNGYRYIRARDAVARAPFIDDGPYKTDQYNREIWDFLDDNGFLAGNGRGFHTVLDLPDHVTAHAIELKQSNWSEALGQVNQAAYADYWWVALDAGHMRAAFENLDAFRAQGVGLLAVAEGGLVEVVSAEQRDPERWTLDREDIRERSVDAATPDDVEGDEDEDGEAEEDPNVQMPIDSFQ